MLYFYLILDYFELCEECMLIHYIHTFFTTICCLCEKTILVNIRRSDYNVLV